MCTLSREADEDGFIRRTKEALPSIVNSHKGELVALLDLTMNNMVRRADIDITYGGESWLIDLQRDSLAAEPRAIGSKFRGSAKCAWTYQLQL